MVDGQGYEYPLIPPLAGYQQGPTSPCVASPFFRPPWDNFHVGTHPGFDIGTQIKVNNQGCRYLSQLQKEVLVSSPSLIGPPGCTHLK